MSSPTPRGPLKCFSCLNISNSLACRSIVTCRAGQKCHSSVSYGSVDEPRIDLGCKNEDECHTDIPTPLSQGCSSCCNQSFCNADLCSVFQVDESWSIWSEWSSCTQTCGLGQNVRHRECTTAGSCVGNHTDVRKCKLTDCNENSWTKWSLWSPCSRTCGMGLRTRTRFCSGNKCRESSAETDFCDNESCTRLQSTTTARRMSTPTTSSRSTNSLSTNYILTPTQDSLLTDSVTDSNTGVTTMSSNSTHAGNVTSTQQTPVNSFVSFTSTQQSSANAFISFSYLSSSTDSSLTTVRFPLVFTSSPTSSTMSLSTSPTSSSNHLTTPQNQQTCRQKVPTIDHGYLTNLTEDLAMFKCYNGYEFTNGGQTVSILCDKSTQTWKEPYPICKSKGGCSKDEDCNAGVCIPISHRCRCNQGYFNTNCDTEIKVGLLVVRGPDWTWGDQDGHGIGNITQITGFTPGWIWVEWLDVDFQNEYRVGAEGKYELMPYKR